MYKKPNVQMTESKSICFNVSTHFTSTATPRLT